MVLLLLMKRLKNKKQWYNVFPFLLEILTCICTAAHTAPNTPTIAGITAMIKFRPNDK